MAVATRIRLAAAAIPVGLLVPAPAYATADTAAASASVSILEDATLIARGAAVKVSVEYALPGQKQFKSVTVNVTQASHGWIATGSLGSGNVVNDGKKHVVVLTVPAQGNRAFVEGPAYAQASAYAANDYDPDPATANATKVIRVRR